MRDVLHHLQVVLARDPHHFVHVARRAHVMHHHHRFRARRDVCLEGGGINREIIGFHIAEHHRRTDVHRAGAARPHRDGRADHLVARLQPDCVERRVERGRPVQARERVFRAVPRCELRLKLLGDVGARHLPLAQHVVRRLEHGVVDDGPCEDAAHLGRFRLADHRRAAEQSQFVRRRRGETSCKSRGRRGGGTCFDEFFACHFFFRLTLKSMTSLWR